MRTTSCGRNLPRVRGLAIASDALTLAEANSWLLGELLALVEWHSGILERLAGLHDRGAMMVLPGHSTRALPSPLSVWAGSRAMTSARPCCWRRTWARTRTQRWRSRDSWPERCMKLRGSRPSGWTRWHGATDWRTWMGGFSMRRGRRTMWARKLPLG